jgi:hypothetical protein
MKKICDINIRKYVQNTFPYKYEKKFITFNLWEVEYKI